MIQTKFQDSEQKPILQSQLLQREAGIDHYCSMRGFEDAGHGVWMPRQVHGSDIVVVDNDTAYDATLELQPVEADAVITREQGRWIGVRTADCVPVLLYDPVKCVIAAVHAGWRGTVCHIVRQTVARLTKDFGVDAADLRAMVGPSISPDAFEIGEEVAQAFVDAGRADCIVRESLSAIGKVRYPKPHADLWQSNVMDLLEVGVDLEHIDCTPLCTVEYQDILFSARRQGIGTGRIVSAICLV